MECEPNSLIGKPAHALVRNADRCGLTGLQLTSKS